MRGPKDELPPRARLDVWLWRARLAKTRGVATELIRGGHVRVNGQKTRVVARGVREGDILTVALERSVVVLRVAALGERRGPATEARTLYEPVGASDDGEPEDEGAV
jgi:ribosome-associated heat shock protein Hsp15